MFPLARQALRGRRNQAEAMALGLSAEVLTVADVLEWVGAPVPQERRGALGPGRNLESAPSDPTAVERALRALPGRVEQAAAEALLVMRLLRFLRSEPTRAEAMLAKLVLSYRLHDPGLRATCRAYHSARETAEHYRIALEPEEQRKALVRACEQFIERAIGDWEWLDALPDSVRS